MLIASSSSFFSIDLQSPALSLRSSANRLYVYKWKHLNEKIWRKWVLYLVLKDELTLLQIRLFVYFDNILLNPALWFRGWTLRFERDAIMWRVILNPKQPSFRTKLGIYHLHTIPHVLKFLYRACTTFSFSLPSLFFHSLIFRQIYTAKRLFWYYRSQQVVPMLHTIFQNIIT